MTNEKAQTKQRKKLIWMIRKSMHKLSTQAAEGIRCRKKQQKILYIDIHLKKALQTLQVFQ